MKSILTFSILALSIFTFSCTSKKSEGPFNYTLIKSKIDLEDNQEEQFDEITSSYLIKIRAVFQSAEGGKEEKLNKAKEISALQDNEIKKILTEEQFSIYKKEIKIEREGREKHNMTLICDALDLDSTQTVQFNLANEAFYTTLIDNHDYYHGKPDVYLQYYKEIDLSRQKAFKQIMSEKQYDYYKALEQEFKIGKSEH